ncbi:Transmembrane protein 8A-like protein [Dinothrombium tinctorium]|uniref:Transmembrane protein 8A-like protein n=1 Tax=Dinothrombium tinctorium TaxID=1965070 RepID=A0A443QTU5_9ACAR|nr:Transmembrane protein 8A-like protein [Dinothrombium tinctorium]
MTASGLLSPTQTTSKSEYVKKETLSAKITVTKCSQSPKASNGIDCPIKIYFRKLSLPAENNFDKSYDCKQSYSRERACYIADLNISRRNWNYLLILIEDEAAENNASVEFELLLSSEECYNSNPNLLSSKSIYYARTAAPISTTTRFPYPSPTSRAKNELISREPFTSPLRSYGYGSQFNQKHSKTCPQHINLMRYNLPGFLEFKFDSPMTLNSSFSSFSPFIGIANGNYSLGNNSLPIVTLIYFEVISLIDSGGNLVIDLGLNPATNTTYHNVSVTLCLNYEYYSLTLEECLKTLTVNTTSEDEMLKSIVIPYPRAGMWFATVKTECLFIEQEKASRVQCEFNTTSILLNIKSSSCNEGKCGKYGDCYHKIDGALMFSTCVCKPELGRKGWWCEDDSEKLHEDQLMLNFLLLTLSNILFIPSVILASCRRHFTEALVYFTTMLSSALYHACDSQSTIAFCVLKLNILQFGDFYSALLCFWVTLISLAQLGDKLRTFLHMFGCIFIGFVVQYDRTSLWAFALPTGIGLIVLFIAWISHCIHRRARHVFGMIRLLFIFFGTSLAIGGLVLYAYFETEENYAITHSVWHGVMALALLPFILAIRTETPEEEEDFRGKGSNYETYYELIAEEASHLARHPLT